jgi:tumor protein p53-inducible protein 3
MKAVIYQGFGDLSVIHMEEVPSPPMGKDQVRIRVRASGLNRADLVQRQGNYPPPPGASDIPGLEISGDIIEAGPHAPDLPVGTRVMALVAGGGYAEEICVDQGLVMPIPAHLSYLQAAAIPEAFLTAHHNLFFVGGYVGGQNVLIHAGASGIGTAAIQLLKGKAPHLFATVGSAAKAKSCHDLGAFPILYKEQNFSEVIAAETNGKGVSLILDTIGGSYLDENLKTLAPGGIQVVIGLLGGRPSPINARL